MKRVAIYTYWYPPARAVASIRLAKFVKYLPAFGWEPFVFTVTPGSSRYIQGGTLADDAAAGHVFRVDDPSLHARVDRLRARLSRNAVARGRHPTAGTYHRSLIGRAAYRLYREFLCFPDEAWPWLCSTRQIAKDSRSIAPDVIFSSSPPGTAHLLAATIGRELGRPWVADYRDPWSQGHTLPRTAPVRALERVVERRALRSATVLTTVSEFIQRQLEALHGKPVFVIPNGYDEDDVPAADPHPASPDRRFTFVHTGLLYERTRTPALFFEALDAAIERGIVNPGDIVVKFYGRNLDIALRALARFPRLQQSVELCGDVAHAESIAAQRRATALLLLEWTDPRARGVVTAKVFEYLAAGRPIFAIAARDGEIDRLLRRTRRGTVATTASELSEYLVRAFIRYRDSGELACEPGGEPVEQFSRRALTRRLADVFSGVVQ